MAGRTLNAIKSHRKQQTYKDLVRSYVPITGGLGVKEAAIPPRRAPRGAGRGRAQASRPAHGEMEAGQPLPRPAALGAEARPSRPHSPPRDGANLSPARAAEIEVHRTHPGNEQTERLPDTYGINTPVRVQNVPIHITRVRLEGHSQGGHSRTGRGTPPAVHSGAARRLRWIAMSHRPGSPGVASSS